MKKVILIIFYFTINTAIGQNQVKKYIDEGIAFHDAGEYELAIEAYEHALYLDDHSSLAHYELAMTLMYIGEYEKSLAHSNRVLELENNFHTMAYVTKGNCLDMLGKSEEALIVYQDGIKKMGGSNLLHYNLALTYSKLNNNQLAISHAETALSYNMGHASSHLLLGTMNEKLGRKIESILNLYYFLFLEPNTSRSLGAYDLLQSQLGNKSGVEETNNGFNIFIDPNSLNNKKDPFSSANLFISMLQITNSAAKKEGKTDQEIFKINTQHIFQLLGELKKKKYEGLYWESYIPFFYELSKTSHLETFCYYISINSDPVSQQWINENNDRIDAFDRWLSGGK